MEEPALFERVGPPPPPFEELLLVTLLTLLITEGLLNHSWICGNAPAPPPCAPPVCAPDVDELPALPYVANTGLAKLGCAAALALGGGTFKLASGGIPPPLLVVISCTLLGDLVGAPYIDAVGEVADTEFDDDETELPLCWFWLGGTPETGPRLCGNCSGRGRECVRSKRPHLLQSWEGERGLISKMIFLIRPKESKVE